MEYGKLPTELVVPHILCKLLTIDREDIEVLRLAFEDRWDYISLDHYDHFKRLIVLTTLVAIRQKAENNEDRKAYSMRYKTPLLTNYTKTEQDYTFKFSRLAF
jgi:hypothetical protein